MTMLTVTINGRAYGPREVRDELSMNDFRLHQIPRGRTCRDPGGFRSVSVIAMTKARPVRIDAERCRALGALPSPRNPGLPGLRIIVRKSGRPDLRRGGRGLGVVRLTHQRRQTHHPPPQPSPTRGEGADRVCGALIPFQTGTAIVMMRCSDGQELEQRQLPRDAATPGGQS
jgi:hypothetical protein